mgnify:CR=1 FL=1
MSTTPVVPPPHDWEAPAADDAEATAVSAAEERFERGRRTIGLLLGPLAFIAIKIVTYVFAPLTSGPIQFSAGILFGLLPGTLYVLIGEVIGLLQSPAKRVLAALLQNAEKKAAAVPAE